MKQSEEDIEGQGDKDGMGEDELKARTGAYKEREGEDDGNVDGTDKTTQRKELGDGAREDCLNGNEIIEEKIKKEEDNMKKIQDTGGEMEGGGETIRNREGEGGHNGKRTESTNTGGDSLCAQTNQHSQLSSSTDSTATVPKKVLQLHFSTFKISLYFSSHTLANILVFSHTTFQTDSESIFSCLPCSNCEI